MAVWTHPWFITFYLGIIFLTISIYLYLTLPSETINALSYLDLIFLIGSIVLFILSLFYLRVFGTDEHNDILVNVTNNPEITNSIYEM